MSSTLFSGYFLIIKTLKEEGWVLNKLIMYICGEVIRLLLKYCIYCRSAPSLHRVY